MDPKSVLTRLAQGRGRTWPAPSPCSRLRRPSPCSGAALLTAVWRRPWGGVAEQVLETGASTSAREGVQRCCNRPGMAPPTLGTAITQGKGCCNRGVQILDSWCSDDETIGGRCWKTQLPVVTTPAGARSRHQRCYNQPRKLLELAEPDATSRRQFFGAAKFLLEPGINGATTSHGIRWNRLYR